jgi:hypothetical protein
VLAWLITTVRREAWRVLKQRRALPSDDLGDDDVREDAVRNEDAQLDPAVAAVLHDDQRRPVAAHPAPCPSVAKRSCGSSPSSTARTTARSPKRSVCRSARSAPPAAGAWPSCARPCPATPRGAPHEPRPALTALADAPLDDTDAHVLRADP